MNDKSDRIAGGPLMSDVAREAGVATSTVSRALARPGRVNEETRRKIAAAAEKLGYTPNAAARNLRVGGSRTMMIVLPGPLFYGASQIIPQVLESIDTALIRRGYSLMIANVDRFEETERRIVDLAYSGTVAGAITVSSPPPASGNRSLASAGIPIVSLLIDLSADGIPSVVTNDRTAMADAVDHLIGLGHRRFFYIAGPNSNFHEVERFAGVLEAIARHGLPQDAVVRFDNDFTFQHGFDCGIAAARAFLALDARPTAALSCADDSAIAFMSTVRQAGVDVPAALSVIGFDGAAVGAFCEPGLTSLLQPTAEMGRIAAEILLDAVAGPVAEGRDSRAVVRHVENSSLLVRASTGPVKQ